MPDQKNTYLGIMECDPGRKYKSHLKWALNMSEENQREWRKHHLGTKVTVYMFSNPTLLHS